MHITNLISQYFGKFARKEFPSFLQEIINNQKEYNKYEIYERVAKNGKSYINMKYKYL